MRLPGLSRLLVRMASTTSAFSSAAPIPIAATASPSLSHAGSQEAMRVKSPLIYSFPISSQENVSTCVRRRQHPGTR